MALSASELFFFNSLVSNNLQVTSLLDHGLVTSQDVMSFQDLKGLILLNDKSLQFLYNSAATLFVEPAADELLNCDAAGATKFYFSIFIFGCIRLSRTPSSYIFCSNGTSKCAKTFTTTTYNYNYIPNCKPQLGEPDAKNPKAQQGR